MAELALHGGQKTKRKAFPVWPKYDENEKNALLEVLESRVWWRTPGTRTVAFEKEFAQFHGAKHGVAVTNGTAALEVVMSGLELKPGDEVIIPDFTFVATASAVVLRQNSATAKSNPRNNVTSWSPSSRRRVGDLSFHLLNVVDIKGVRA